ncbi:MAG: hypothetical protein ACI9UK_000803 [Candidatus Krumholzibacteriia bacterium]|jgi:hypothetical protein
MELGLSSNLPKHKVWKARVCLPDFSLEHDKPISVACHRNLRAKLQLRWKSWWEGSELFVIKSPISQGIGVGI